MASCPRSDLDVSVEHARFMAARFMHAWLPSVAVWGDSLPGERAAALADLAAGRVRAVFTVDLFNEGIDVPNRYRRRRRLADYVTVATLALPPPGNDSEERLEKAEGLAEAVHLYAEVLEVDPGSDSEVVHRFARMLLALEEFEPAGLCPEEQLERQVPDRAPSPPRGH
jgi:hypothetical protein